jgi:FdhD protein
VTAPDPVGADRQADEPDPMRGGRPGPTVTVRVQRFGAAIGRPDLDEVAAEEPLEIRVEPPEADRSFPVSVTMRTPGHDFELAAGFALSEGIVRSPEEIRGIRYCTVEGSPQWFNIVTIDLPAGRPFDPEAFRRNVYTTSSCGICGRAALDRVRLAGIARPSAALRFGPDRLLGLAERLRERQAAFARTGGLHATGVADSEGRIGIVREDVGRHNAFDKVVGRLALDRELPAAARIAVVSGRASFELVQKALIAGFPALVAVGAPSHLAVALAEEYGLTLVGFLRPDGFTVYAGAERLVPASGAERRASAAVRGTPG